MNTQLIIDQLKVNKKKYYLTAYYYLKNEQDALDAIQELSFKAVKYHKKLKSYDFLDTYLTKILINHCLDFLRKKQRDKKLLESLVQNNTIVTDNDLTLNISLKDALENLKPKYQEVIVLKYFEDLKTSEISFILNKPESTVKTWLRRGISDLKKDYTKEVLLNESI